MCDSICCNVLVSEHTTHDAKSNTFKVFYENPEAEKTWRSRTGVERSSVRGCEVVTPPRHPAPYITVTDNTRGSLEGNGGSQSAKQPPSLFWFPNLTSGKLKFCYVNNFCWHISLQENHVYTPLCSNNSLLRQQLQTVPEY